MIIELDFEKKEIILKDNVSLGDLIDKLKGLGLDCWKTWKVKVFEKTTEFIPYYPITYPVYPIYPTYDTPYKPPYIITCDTGTTVTN